MGIGPFSTYAPPGTYVQTTLEPAIAQQLGGIRIAALIGVGKETLSQTNFELLRGSSSVADTPVFGEDAAGRWIVSGSDTNPVLGNQDGGLTRFKIRNVPVVDGTGRGRTTYDVSKVSVSVNNQQVVVAGLDGVNGIITLLVPPTASDFVTINYYFHRKDTRVTDTVSAQVTAGSAVLVAPQAETYTITASTNDRLDVTVNDAVIGSIILTSGTRTATDVANDINSAAISGLTASVHIDAQGLNHVQLVATGNIQIGSGTANGALGFNPGDYTNRTKSFRVFNGPIVDGSDGGITTTDPTKVVVVVNGTQVIAVAVDGANRLVTLPFAPRAGSIVTIQYYFNTFQDTFDYLPNSKVTSVGNVGIGPSRRDYLEGVDFTIANEGDMSKIQWGTSFQVIEGVKTGSIAFGSTQIVGFLVDNRIYGQLCERYSDSVTGSVSTTKFVLPIKPTTGNGRDTPLGSSLYQTVTNGRIDLPTDRPDLVTVYTGKTWRDAASRPAVTVLEVDSSNNTITLKGTVPADYNAYATFWYNRIQDDSYTFSVISSGPAGVGTYKVSSQKTGSDLFGVKFGVKSGLSTTVQWPSGSESVPDALHTGDGNPVPETVTVTFDNSIDPATHASVTGSGQEPYDIFTYTRKFGGVIVDGNPAATVDLSLAYRATMISSGVTAPLAFLSTDRLVFKIDGIVLASTDVSAATTMAQVAAAINVTIDADTQTHSDGSGTFASTSPNALASVLTYGTQSILMIKGRGVPSFTNGLLSSVSVLSPTVSGETDATTKVGLAANQSATGSYNAINQVATLVGTKDAPFTITSGVDDSLQLNVDGSDLSVTLPSGTGIGLTEVVEAINDQYIAVASATDIATYTANVIVLSNELRGDYNAHRVSTVFHVAADVTNSVVLAAAVTLGDSITLLNDIKAKFNAHLSQSGVHQMDDGSNLVSVADATNLQSAVVLANHLKDAYNLHLAQLGVHGYDDSVNTQTSLVPPAVIADTFPLLNDIKVKFNLHRIQSGVHIINDAVNIVAAANAIDSLTAQTLSNAIKAALNAHYSQVGVHFVADATNIITSADASSDPTTITLTTELQAKYETHLSDIEGLIHAHGTNDTANVTTSVMSELVARVGLGANANQLVLTSRLNTVQSNIEVKNTGTANDILGFVSGITVQRHQPSAADISGALNAASAFVTLAVAYRVSEPGLGSYLEINSRTVGNTSTLSFSSVTNTAFITDTGLGIIPGTTSDVGENAQSGFLVASSQGSLGSHGTGFPGQSYTDSTTGLRFTILPASSGDYTSGGSFTMVVNQSFLADGAIPIRAVAGVETTVYNTNGMNPDTTAILNTYQRSGAEPAVGDIYYISYEYQKSDLSTQLFRDNRKIQSAFGSPTPEFPLSLAARLAQLNGAVVVALKQVLKVSGTSQASVGSFTAAIDEMRKPISGSVKPDVITPLGTDPLISSYLNQHCIFMGSPRQEGERIGVVGVSAGTSPTGVQAIAKGLNSELMLVTYPDSFVISVEDAVGNTTDQLVDSSYAAAALAGSLTNPAFDAATPLTRRQVIGFKRLGRVMDPTEANQVAVNGVTIIDQLDTGMRVRHGLTTNVESVLTRTPSVTLTIQFVQQSLRAALDVYIGQKLTASLITSINSTLTGTFNNLIGSQIVNRVAGVEVVVDENDPTIIRVSAIYIPVFPLEYIMVNLSVRVRS